MMYTPPRGLRMPRVNHALVPRIAEQPDNVEHVYALDFDTPGMEQYVDWYNSGTTNAYKGDGDPASDDDDDNFADIF